MSDAPRIDPDNPPAHIVDDVLEHNPPLPWEDPWFDSGYDGNDGEEEVWPPQRSGWPTPAEFWP